MLRNHKKILLVGLLALVFFGLIYIFLNSRPEMVIDDNLRVPEASNPELDRIMGGPSSHKADQQPSQEANTPVIAPKRTEQLAEQDNTDEQATDAAQPESQELAGESLAQEVINTAPVEQATAEVVATAPPVNQEHGSAEPPAPDTATSNYADVLLLSDQEGFIDLNLTEVKPIKLTLLEGDDIIIDDVNEKLGRYSPSVVANNSRSSEHGDQENVQLVTIQEVEHPSDKTDLIQVEDWGDEDSQPDFMVLPEPDQALMNGKDAISLEYQASFKKLSLVISRLKAANEEHVQLQHQFDEAASESQRLSQIIRDVDAKIKRLKMDRKLSQGS
ncbi:MAG: hypothetical protein CSB47_05120 [Proteobacteria bacterium]|nr:MAG: hypothetical protein CSB47_05120 [Pseudomonadota bacterium]